MAPAVGCDKELTLKAIAVLFVGILLILAGVSIRNQEIDKCEDCGGIAITEPWYSETWWVVKCLEGERQ